MPASPSRRSALAERPRVELPIEISWIHSLLYPHDLMSELSKPRRESLVARSPPGPFDRHQHKRARSQRTPEPLLPVPRIYNLRRNRHGASVRYLPDLARQVFRIDGRLIQRNAVRDDVDVDEPDSCIEIASQTCRIFQSCPRELGCSMRDNDLKIGNRSRREIAGKLAAASCFVLHAWKKIAA